MGPFLLEVNLKLLGFPFTGTVRCVVPAPPSVVETVKFKKGPKMSAVGTVVLNSITDTTVTSRPVAITFNGGSAGVTVDMINPAATFIAPTGETGGVATPTGDVNPFGAGPAGVAFPFSIPSLPEASVVTAVTFVAGP